MGYKIHWMCFKIPTKFNVQTNLDELTAGIQSYTRRAEWGMRVPAFTEWLMIKNIFVYKLHTSDRQRLWPI